MKPPILITPANRHLLDEWWSKAMTDLSVWPFMAFQPHTSLHDIESDDWSRIHLMSSNHRAYMRCSQDRGTREMNICVWGLGGEQTRPSNAVGQLMRQLPALARRYDLRYVRAACHASNETSVRLLTKRFGQPWGREPEAAWNGRLGRYEDAYHFRLKVKD